MTWTVRDILFAIFASPVLLVIAIFSALAPLGEWLKYGFEYLFCEAWDDLIYVIETRWIKWRPKTQSKDTELRKENAAVYESMGLEPGAGQIRLLEVFPNDRLVMGEIRCKLIRVERGTCDYTALSYTWGNPTLSHRIRVNGKPFMITQNLYTALKHLRKTVPRVWIDAVCIDQSNNKERSDQVQQMKYIFRNAKNVIVWLGKAPNHFERLHPLFSTLRIGFSWRGLDDIFVKLLLHPWWKRMWVIQELILAPNVTVQCSDYEVRWEQFVNMVELFCNHANRKLDEVSNARNMALTRSQWQSNVDFEYGLLSLAWQFREREAGDARDKLYALLGLLSETDGILAADYSKNPKDVFKEFAQVWINQHKSLLIMNLSQRQTSDNHSTWYPVWSKTFGNTPEFFCGSSFNQKAQHFWEGRFSADGGRQPPDCLHHPGNKRILRLQGFIYDVVTDVASVSCMPIDETKSLDDDSGIIPMSSVHRGPNDDWERCMSEWRQFALSRASSQPEKDKATQEFWLTTTAGLVEHEGQMVDYQAVQSAACRGRRLFVTRNGELGLGPADVGPGDKVCVLFGSPVPFILSECQVCRLDEAGTLYTQGADTETTKPPPEATGNIEQKKLCPTWKYVGDSYLHSTMHYQGDVGIDIVAGDVVLEDFFFCD